MAQWQAKQALDIGCYGIVFPHISTVEEAYNAVAACRYPRLKTAPHYEPAGIRGDGPTGAVRYWGLTQQEYYQKADVWPLDPQGRDLRASCRSRTCAASKISTTCSPMCRASARS